MSSDDDSDKNHEPTQKKLDDARKKGDIPKSTDLTTAAGYGGFILAAMSLGPVSLIAAGDLMSVLLGQANGLSKLVFNGGPAPVFGGIIFQLVKAFGPWLALPGILALGSIVAQQSLIFAPSKLAPKLNRISPISGAKNKFGRSGLFEFFKSFSKLTIYCVILGFYLTAQLPRILAAMNLSPGQITTELLRLTIGMMSIVLVVAVILGGVDLLWQRAEHTRKNMMSRKEITDEHKNSEGDPAMKQQRRQKAINIAMNQMLVDIKDADVIIVNPTHYAVALKWDRSSGQAPICIGKGVDDVARRIREVANENAVPIHSDPPTARAMYASVEIGSEIEPDHYRAVAAAIRFAEKIRQKVSFL